MFGLSKQMVAKAAYDALMKLELRITTTDTPRKIQSIHYVSSDAEATAAFIEVFSNSQSQTSDQCGKVSRCEYFDRADRAAVKVDLQKSPKHDMLAESLSSPPLQSQSFTTGSNSFAAARSQAVVPQYSEQYRYNMVTSCGIDVQIYCGNLLDAKVDAIVNPANSQLLHGGGAARAIAAAAGKQLEEECRAYIRQHNELKVTQVMHTTAGKMNPPVLYVIHVVGPSASEFPNPADLYKAVFDTFDHCMLYANNFLHVSSLCIPAVSSGE